MAVPLGTKRTVVSDKKATRFERALSFVKEGPRAKLERTVYSIYKLKILSRKNCGKLFSKNKNRFSLLYYRFFKNRAKNGF